MSDPIKEYIPKPEQTNQPQPTPTYELKSSASGKISPRLTITVAGNKIEIPYLPKSNCKKCMGKGYLGYDVKQSKVFMCLKCYPNIVLNKK